MILVNPDIHGRTFWKDHINVDDYSQIVFLGDYLDPYSWENIEKEEALNNFKEILEFKKNFPDKVTLLLGNHDTHYLFGDDDCRIDSFNYIAIKNLFVKEYQLFKLGIIIDKVSFTHAPIQKEWKDNNCVKAVIGNNETLEDIIYKLNNLWKDSVEAGKFSKIETILCRASWVRGGWDNYGSPIWSDVRELSKEDDPWPGYYQIFGHTQLEKDAIICDHFACLDCRKSFEVTIDNNKINIAEA
jgi:hypothetical protein